MAKKISILNISLNEKLFVIFKNPKKKEKSYFALFETREISSIINPTKA